MELKTLKTSIQTHQKTRFIQYFISPVGALILFKNKPDGSFCLYINYQKLNKLVIKNRYLLLLIGKFLDRFSWAKQLWSNKDYNNQYKPNTVIIISNIFFHLFFSFYNLDICFYWEIIFGKSGSLG